MNRTLAERDSAIVADYNNNKKIAEIAAQHGVSEQTVLTIVRNARADGQVTREPRVRHASEIDPTRNERIVAMYNAGSTLNDIGEYFGLTRERVRQILNKIGVDRRSMTEHTEINKLKVMAMYGRSIDVAFDEVRSIGKVVEQFKGKIPARWVRQYLEPRKFEALRTNNAPQLWSNEEIVSILRRASDGKGSLSIGEYRKWRNSISDSSTRPPTHTVISWRFGSWRQAVTVAGLAEHVSRRQYSRRWDSDAAVHAVATYVDEATSSGVRPTFSGYDAWSRQRPDYPSSAYIRHLTGMSWSQILRSVLSRQTA